MIGILGALLSPVVAAFVLVFVPDRETRRTVLAFECAVASAFACICAVTRPKLVLPWAHELEGPLVLAAKGPAIALLFVLAMIAGQGVALGGSGTDTGTQDSSRDSTDAMFVLAWRTTLAFAALSTTPLFLAAGIMLHLLVLAAARRLANDTYPASLVASIVLVPMLAATNPEVAALCIPLGDRFAIIMLAIATLALFLALGSGREWTLRFVALIFAATLLVPLVLGGWAGFVGGVLVAVASSFTLHLLARARAPAFVAAALAPLSPALPLVGTAYAVAGLLESSLLEASLPITIGSLALQLAATWLLLAREHATASVSPLVLRVALVHAFVLVVLGIRPAILVQPLEEAAEESAEARVHEREGRS